MISITTDALDKTYVGVPIYKICSLGYPNRPYLWLSYTPLCTPEEHPIDGKETSFRLKCKNK